MTNRPYVLPVLLACAFLATSCVPIYVDQERYQIPQSVQGHLPLDAKTLGRRNADRLEEPLADGGDHGRISDPLIDPSRVLAPGHVPPGKSAPERDRPLSFAEERAYFRTKGRLPKQCVALSGGGIRSAAFSMGVLSALYAHGDLDRTDIISAVSGGAYTMSWYYAQQLRHWGVPSRDLDALLFDPQGAFQTYVAENAAIFNAAGYSAVTVADLAASPLNLLANGVFGWHLNTTPARRVYEYRLRNLFQRPPLKIREENGVPDERSNEAGSLRQIGFEDLRRMLADKSAPHATHGAAPAGRSARKDLPYFIVNATAFIEPTSDYHGAALRNSIYEFTPLMFGSDAYGRFRYDPARQDWPITFGRAISVSGAALDGNNLIAGNSQRTLWSLLNLDLGYYMSNPALHPSVVPQHRVLPFPLYYLDHYPRDLKGTDIYLSDGGHSENLGAYALVRRMCENILIVDGEADPTYEFEAYYNLKAGLKRDMGVLINVPQIEALRNDELLELRRDAVARDRPDLREDIARTLTQAQRDAGLPLIDPLRSRRWREIASHPVMQGSVACLPHPDLPDGVLNVRYVKLAYRVPEGECLAMTRPLEDCAAQLLPHDLCWRDRIVGKRNDRAAEVAKHYYCETNKTHEERMDPSPIFGVRNLFPQEPTTDQNFSEWQFRAYRDLGRRVMEAAYSHPPQAPPPVRCN